MAYKQKNDSQTKATIPNVLNTTQLSSTLVIFKVVIKAQLYLPTTCSTYAYKIYWYST